MIDANTKRDTRAHNWVGTINNISMIDVEYLEFFKSIAGVRYFIGQRELAPTSGKEHIQFFIQFEKQIRFSQVKKLLPEGCHFGMRYRSSTNAKARDYVSKTESRIGELMEFGEFVEERQRKDLEGMVELIDSGASELDVSNEYTSLWARYPELYNKRKALSKEAIYKTKRRELEVWYLHGKTRTGKTSYVLDKYGDENVYVVQGYKFPFDDYEHQDVIVFDDYYSQIEFSSMLRYLDRYPLRLPARFRNKQACYKKVYFTSNEPLSKQYEKLKAEKPDAYAAFQKRIHHIVNFDVPHERDHLFNHHAPYTQPTQVCLNGGMRKLTPEEEEDMPW